MPPLAPIAAAYFAAANILGFALMGIDKARARRGEWRIRESTLFLAALAGGSLGTTAGMYAFRHKTKHPSFVILMPLILALQTAAALIILL